jgi:acyl phosphate:glycerol-3-phosphate acyltransferase
MVANDLTMMDGLSFIFWLIFAYVSGSMPWSVWLGRLIYGVDPRDYGDGNPGAANAFRAAGKWLGVAVIILDFLKAFLPVLLAKWGAGLPDGQLFWVALAPTIGHAFSVFLRFRGGRALVTFFGVWSGLTLHELPIVMGITAIIFTVALKRDEYASIAILVAAALYLLLRQFETWMLMLAMAQLLVLIAKIGPGRLRVPIAVSTTHHESLS